MIRKELWMSALVAMAVTACGGGSSGGADTTAPTVTSVTTTQNSATSLTLTAAASDNVGVSAYCFTSTATAPSSGDACFQASNQKTVTVTLPMTQYYVWAKDAANNVSAASVSGPCSAAGYTASAASTLPTVCMMTSLGEMVFALENVKAPVTVANFLTYVNEGFFKDTVFHRVISNFMVQGGGYTYSSGAYTAKAATHAAIALEAPAATGLSNTAGTIAMARTAVLNSATSQFFVNTVDNSGSLDTGGGGYAVFGRQISGVSTLSAIKSVAVVANPGTGELSQPSSPPVIQWALQLK
jgi:peptidyl-prolyl cis-trans isomerase A (cyclophilin A)